jgi:hypothetical protein
MPRHLCRSCGFTICERRSLVVSERHVPGGTPVADQFKTAFGVNDAEARCLVYEITTDLRATGKYDSKPVDIARKVASRCTLVLTAPR